VSSDPKQRGATVKGASGAGDEGERGGPAGTGGADRKRQSLAEEGEKKVLNDELMEKVLAPENLRAALRAVKANKGVAGIDGIGTGELPAHLRKHWEGIRAKLESGRYRPSPVKAVEIEKSGGGERRLGIPTTVDRMIQQALHQVLDGVFDPCFSDHSHGFRKGRSAHDAVKAAQAYVVEEGREHVVEIDIKAFFDHIDHDILMRMVADKVRDKRVLKLIGRCLRAGVLEKGKVKRSTKGTPQGGPLSPLLGNIYLDALDRELESRGVAFCRYADDVTIYARSARSAERILASISKWIEKNLRLEVNREKSGTRPPDEGSFLGFRIEKDGRIALSEKSIEAFKAAVRLKWDNRRTPSGVETLEAWRKYARGWMSYFRLSERSWDWEDLEGWIRRHIRKWFWIRWHDWKGRRNALRRLGLPPERIRLAHSSRGAWRVALALNTVLPNRWLKSHGFSMPSEIAKAWEITT